MTEVVAAGSSQGYVSDLEAGCGGLQALHQEITVANGLYRATKESGAWTNELLSTNASFGQFDLALSSDCTPHAVYYAIDATPRGVVHAWKPHGEAWRHEYVSGGWAPSIAIDAEDRVHIAFANPDVQLYYGTLTVTGWQLELADSRFAGKSPSIAIDSAGRPHIAHGSYVNFANPNDPCCGHLLYATKRTDGTWLTTTVDNEGIHTAATLRMGPDDQPRVAYLYFRDQLSNGGLMEYETRFAEPLASVPARLG